MLIAGDGEDCLYWPIHHLSGWSALDAVRVGTRSGLRNSAADTDHQDHDLGVDQSVIASTSGSYLRSHVVDG